MAPALLYGLVVLSAIAHAIWNGLMKSAGDRTLIMVAIRSAGLLFGLVALPFVDWPAPESSTARRVRSAESGSTTATSKAAVSAELMAGA